MFRREEVERILEQARRMDLQLEMFGASDHQYRIGSPVDLTFGLSVEEEYGWKFSVFPKRNTRKILKNIFGEAVRVLIGIMVFCMGRMDFSTWVHTDAGGILGWSQPGNDMVRYSSMIRKELLNWQPAVFRRFIRIGLTLF